MKRAARIITGIGILAMVSWAADEATRDCHVAPYRYENCLWFHVQTRLGLSPSLILRMALLEGVGLALAALLYFAWSYVLPLERGRGSMGKNP